MKRITVLLIILLAAIIFSAIGWYLFVRNPEVPLGEAIRDALPFGSGENLDIPGLVRDEPIENPSEQTSHDQFSSPVSKLFRLSDTPVAGAVMFKKTNPNQLVVRYAERATGHIYDVVLPATASSTTLDKTRITNTTLPKIYEAHFRPDGSAVLFRSLRDDSDTVDNLSLTLTPPIVNARATSASTSSPQANEFYTVSSTALRGDISSVSIGSGNNLFYALRDTKSIVASAFNGTAPRTLLTSPFTNWRLTSTGNSLVAYTKASANVGGFAYTLNSSSGGLNKILGPLNGLVVITNSLGNRVLYSYLDGGKMRLSIKNLQSGAVSQTPIETMAEKCVWSIKNINLIFCATPVDWTPSGEPDNWYRGLTHFSDRIWSFDTEKDVGQVIAEPTANIGIDIDAIDLKLSPDEDYLIFTNKNDLSLWAIRL